MDEGILLSPFFASACYAVWWGSAGQKTELCTRILLKMLSEILDGCKLRTPVVVY